MLDKTLFSIGSFNITWLVVILIILLIVLLLAVLAFRRNYILQVKLSRLMDGESALHNSQGIVVLLKKRRKMILKETRQVSPAILIVSIDNLGSLYVGYKNKQVLMKQIASVFTNGLGKVEMAGRIDFNKFCVLLGNRNREEGKAFIARLNEQLNDLEIENYGLYSFDLSCAVYENVPLVDPKRELELAISTLQYATVKDGFISYYSEDVLNSVEKLDLINSLKDASLENNQFVPYVQPKVNFRDGKVTGGEVLVRWVDQDQNIIYRPDEFIPLFESNGFIRKIDMKMFEETCAILQTLKNSGHTDVVLSTNFSKLTLNSLKNTDELLEITKKYGIDPTSIEIEITETEFMESASVFANSLMKLRQAGFRVAMDDFGKEYSSLSLLIDNKFDTIKVDKFFFGNNLSTDKEKNVVAHLIKLLSKIGCKIVLEGIETLTTIDFLATVDRNIYLQGYYFSKPIQPSKFEAFVETTFDFDYPEIEEVQPEAVVNQNATTAVPGATINVTATAPAAQSNSDVEALKVQMEEMRRQFDRQLAEQREQAHRQDMDYMNQQLEALRKQQEAALKAQQPQVLEPQLVVRDKTDGRDDEISRLRRELEDMRYQQERDRRDRYDRDRDRYDRYDRYDDRYEGRYDSRNRDYDDLQRQIHELRQQKQEPQQQIDVAELIEKLSKTQQANIDNAVNRVHMENQGLRDKLEQERKEREELESLLKDLQNKPEDDEDDEEITVEAKETMEKEQEEADKNLNLDLNSLSNSDDSTTEAEEDDEEEDEEEEAPKVQKPELTLEEIEAIIKSYQDKYMDQWNQHAKDELKDGYWEVVNGLKYYKGKKKKTFVDKIKKASPEVKQLFNIIKNDMMHYAGVTNRLTNSYDVFYLGRKQIAKISMTSARVKVYLAVDPSTYTGHIPHKDVSGKKAHQRTPFYTLVKSQLSVKRVKALISEMMTNHSISENENYKPIDYATKYKFFKSNQKK